VSAFSEQRRERAGDEPCAADVDAHHAVPQIEIDLIEALAAHAGRNRCIVDESADLAFALRYIVGKARDRIRIVEIEGDEACLRELAEFQRSVAAGILQNIAQPEPGMMPRTGARDCAAHPTRE